MSVLDDLMKKYPTVSKCIIEAFLDLGGFYCKGLKETFRKWRLEKYKTLDDLAFKADRLGKVESFMGEKYRIDEIEQAVNDFNQEWNKLPISDLVESCAPANDFFDAVKDGTSSIDTGSIQALRDKLNRAEHLAHLAMSMKTKVKMAQRGVENYIDKLSTYINLLDDICGEL